jgi:Acyl-CoA dehydrogenase, C-terminal domain
MDPETLDLLTASLEHVLTEDSGRSLVERLDDLGWDDVVAEDEVTALRLLFEMKGRTLSSDDVLGPRLSSRLADALGTAELADARLIFPESLHPDALSSRVDGDELHVAGIMLEVPARDAQVVTLVSDDNGANLATFSTNGQVTCSAVGGMDPNLGLVRIEGSVPARGATPWGALRSRDAWDAAVAFGRWMLAAELVGIGRHVVTHAAEYAGERHQYGRAIGSFQAVQHRLASAWASVLGASSVVEEAAASRSPWVAKVAKASAGRAVEDACTQAQQVYGAIGFTWEHGFHRYLRRNYVLDRLLGDWRTLEYEIGAQLQSAREVPRIGAL